MMPIRTSLLPTSGDPVIAATLADVVAGNPNMCVISPLPKSRRPSVTDARFRHDLDAHRRRGHIDIDGDSSQRDGGCGNGPRPHHQPQQQSLTRSSHSVLLLDVTCDSIAIELMAETRYAYPRLTATKC